MSIIRGSTAYAQVLFGGIYYNYIICLYPHRAQRKEERKLLSYVGYIRIHSVVYMYTIHNVCIQQCNIVVYVYTKCAVVSTSGVRGNKLDGKTRRDLHIVCSTKLTTISHLGNNNYRHFLLPYKLFGCVYRPSYAVITLCQHIL